jgi:glycosyltransferase involved in cell wall biosynthesis
MATKQELFQEKVECAVVVPAYGEPKYLKTTLESIVRSQGLEVRLLVLDDGSTSEFIENIVSGFSPRVHFLKNSENLGISENFNLALRVANAKFVMLAGPDDLLTTCITEVVRDSQRINLEFVALLSIVETVNLEGKAAFSLSGFFKSLLSPRRGGVVANGWLRFSLLIGNWTFNPAIIWNTSVLDSSPYNKDYRYCMDWDLLLKLAREEFNFYFSEICVFQYRRHLESVSMENLKGRFEEEKSILSSNYESARNYNFFAFVTARIAIMPRLNYYWRSLQNFLNKAKI